MANAEQGRRREGKAGTCSQRLATALTLGLAGCSKECGRAGGGHAGARRRNVRIHHLHNWKVIAQNHATAIFRAFDARHSEEVCVKRLEKDKAKQSPGVTVDFRREAQLLLALDNPGVVRGFGLLEDRHYLYLVQELGQRGDLFHLAEQFKHHCIQEAYVRDNIACPLLQALADLHSRGIAHRDLKPENIVITANGSVKLCDLGLAIEMTRWPATAAVGTTEFQAPELVHKKQCSRRGRANSVPQPYDPKASDVWSLGALLYEALCGRSPFTASTRSRVEQNILACRYSFPRELELSEQCKDFLASCLQERPRRRPSVQQLLAHVWLSSTGVVKGDKVTHHVTPRSQSTSNLISAKGDTSTESMAEAVASAASWARENGYANTNADHHEAGDDSDSGYSSNSPQASAKKQGRKTPKNETQYSSDEEQQTYEQRQRNSKHFDANNEKNAKGNRLQSAIKAGKKSSMSVRNGRYFRKQRGQNLRQELLRKDPALTETPHDSTPTKTAAPAVSFDDSEVSVNVDNCVPSADPSAHNGSGNGLTGVASASLKRKAAQKAPAQARSVGASRGSTGTNNSNSSRVLRALNRAADLAASTRHSNNENDARRGMATSTHKYDATLPNRSNFMRLLIFNGSHPVFH